ncbi:MAG TPA: hypothetical protein VNM37_03420 [Candidatus Dormibacteraeota bacterium]|nr:hypothetical protein [Candidatus Dormibacteraeota bacterium]
MSEQGRALDPPAYGQPPAATDDFWPLERTVEWQLDALLTPEGLSLVRSLTALDEEDQPVLTDTVLLSWLAWQRLVEVWVLHHPDAAQRLAAKVKPLCKETPA